MTTSPGFRPGSFVYTDDQGRRYAVKLALRFGGNPVLGFVPYNRDEAGVLGFPATGLAMRHVNVSIARRGCAVGCQSAS